MYKKIKENIVDIAFGSVLLGICALGFISTNAFAASSFSPANFYTIVNSLIVPIVDGNSSGAIIAAPAITTSVASSTTGGSLTRGPLRIEIAALSLSGTSSPSNELGTTTQGTNSQLQLTWPPIPGATGYAVYIGTSTPGSEKSYFLSTSTAGVPNTYYTLTSTSTPTYYSIPGLGAGFFTSEGSATTSIDTNGLMRAQSSATTTCTTALSGAVFYSTANAHLWLCTGGGPTWTLIK